jgi:hypothetical protein
VLAHRRAGRLDDEYVPPPDRAGHGDLDLAVGETIDRRPTGSSPSARATRAPREGARSAQVRDERETITNAAR